jgi:DNA-binding Lrp family transcriptional regulator
MKLSFNFYLKTDNFIFKILLMCNMDSINPFTYEKLIEFDVKDEKINVELQKNSRNPVSVISKHVGLSRDVVSYRINQMIKKGWIQNFIPILSINKLGLHWYTILLKLKNPSPQVEQKLKNYLIKEMCVRWSQKCAGPWDVTIHINAPGMLHLNKIFAEVRKICGGYLQDYELVQGIKEWKYNNLVTGYLKHVKKDVSIEFPFGRFDESESAEEIDETNVIILNKLIENAETPLIEISKTADLSADATAARIRSLKKKGIIKGFITVVNTPMQNCGLYIVLFQLNSPTDENKKKLIDFLRSHQFVSNVAEFQGKYDLWVHIWAKNAGHFNEILTETRTQFLDLIRDYTTLIGIGEYKFGNPIVK